MPTPARFGGLRFTFVWTGNRPLKMANNLKVRAKQITPALLADLSGLTDDMKSYAQANAPWQDRTGDARRNLDFHLNPGKTSGTIVGRHGVPYGGYLETGTSHMSAYPIIGPTLQAHYAEVRSIMNQIAGSG